MELSSQQAAQVIGVSELTIRNYIDRGLLPARRMGLRRIVRIRPDDLRIFAETYGFAFNEDRLKQFLSE